ncbi:MULTISPECIES: CvpA family protein [Gemmobacter]|jgi:membrane protein required for colicin V production|uniref:Membrane protein required for colicin V production n=2 Tax=Gemmobacter TaxID=204456 RepID=A0A2T6ARC8_9RHOB|nr:MULTISPECIES: CvpA family protein [Gemmobacter]OJY29352.1 MAG: colicin V production CvpA [Rhodobacterales bacterium 65-51]PTX46350.1 membrane protein required for colicin V production [Gemmobacter caeni]TWI95182.1 membrane protein required for colicin V production [Gemmobacter caeni]GHC10264.1 colicin V production protein CvpA [Gemmobacter nanjingensis]
MEGFTIIDGVVAGVIVLSAILAYSRGLIREAMAILGWIGAALLAYLFAAEAQPLVKELPVVGQMLADSCELSVIAAFAAVFAVGLVVAAIFTPLLSGWVNQTMLGGLDQGLGFLFGVVRGVVLVAIAFIVYDRAVASNSIPMVDNSRSAKVFASFQGNIDDQIPSDAPGWIVSKYEGLVSICAAPAEPAAPEAPATNN